MVFIKKGSGRVFNTGGVVGGSGIRKDIESYDIFEVRRLRRSSEYKTP